MITIQELRKGKIQLRNIDPAKATIYTLILDNAGKAAKDENREPEEKDVLAAIKKLIKQNEGAIDLIKTKNGDTTTYDKEVIILKSMLPAQLTEEQCKAKLQEMISSLPEAERNRKSQGKIMGQLKSMSEIDMGMASKILNGLW